MPIPLQCLSAIVPARWYVDAIRKIMIQGAEIQFVLKEIGILLFVTVVLVALSLKTFNNRLN